MLIDPPRRFLYPSRIANFPNVTVIGGGLAGLAASLDLDADLRVLCIEPRTGARQRVGESLDWSTLALLAGLGIAPSDLLDPGFANWKRGVTLSLKDGSAKKHVSKDWLSGAPITPTCPLQLGEPLHHRILSGRIPFAESDTQLLQQRCRPGREA